MKKSVFAIAALTTVLLAGPLLAQTPPKPAAPPATMAALIDVNSASKAQLSSLKGIGDARSDAIIKGRPYKGKDELVQKGIIPQSVYDGIKDQIIARQK